MKAATTWAVGDIHGDLAALERLLGKLLPRLEPADTLVFLGDYVDRGPNSVGVIERVTALEQSGPCQVVALRGNHEDTWAQCFEDPEPAFLLHPGNGCAATWRSYTGSTSAEGNHDLTDDEILALLDVPHWLPAAVATWMAARPTWYEDEHAIYVHAGLDGKDGRWDHPSAGREKALLWMREPAFFSCYEGKRVVFGHTRTHDLPTDHLGFFGQLFDSPADVWLRGDLVGVDTGAGMGGFLSAVGLPALTVIESR